MNYLNQSALYLEAQGSANSADIGLPASKSLSNRALILNSLSKQKAKIENLSPARDTRLMNKLLIDSPELMDVQDAGTTMRFLTAYLALTNQRKKLTGTTRMLERPIGILVEALRQIGAEIEYLGETGFPPLATKGFEKQLTNKLSIPGNISSQYISGLLMMAPKLPNGLEISIKGKLMSKPYVEMTLKLMEKFGVTHSWQANTISVQPQEYIGTGYRVESDWSAASYWYSVVALSSDAEIFLEGLPGKSLQGDRQMADLMEGLGCQTVFTEHGARIKSQPPKLRHIEYDFSSCPDLSLTVIALCAVLGISGELKGLESLRIKETDRIGALQQELAKFGAGLREENHTWNVVPAKTLPDHPIYFHTYEDHRMAMALAPLCLRFPIIIEDPGVVEKSYPSFWEDMQAAGLTPSPHPEGV